MAGRKKTRRKSRPQLESAPSDTSTEAVAKRLQVNQADEYERFLRYYAMANSDEDHEVTIAEMNEAQLLLGKYGPYVVDYIFLGPFDPLHPLGRRFPISNTDYKVLTGKSATVCPRAKPQLGVRLVAGLADSLRRRGLIGMNQTIHYTGPQAEPDAICECVLAEMQAAADGATSSHERLTIDLESNSLTLDGTRHDKIDPTALRLVNALSEAARNGNPIVSGAKLSQTVHGCRGGEKAVRRCLSRLPDAIRSLVRAATGKGRWLELPPPE